jgi:hypothetical protein
VAVADSAAMRALGSEATGGAEVHERAGEHGGVVVAKAALGRGEEEGWAGVAMVAADMVCAPFELAGASVARDEEVPRVRTTGWTAGGGKTLGIVYSKAGER